ncbi:GDSL-type esterase/lipase family protein [Dyella acidiphila]|uniref:GDSL family lipase n=1 Tax=Dyella acidiphila TaxID=2775866 RepID=A0ABR9GCH1_9GAMM|nr:GDSL-type esterase/lipase family protein [Dyella acidiphila]MBE1161748.1 GDSL family lipase [Dyella acidiphila]
MSSKHRLPALLLAVLLPVIAHAAAPANRQAHWATTWEQAMTAQVSDKTDASRQLVRTAAGDPVQEIPTLANFTLRQYVRISIGTPQLRLRFSNVFGRKPLVIDAAHVGLGDGVSGVVAGSDRAVTFGGNASGVIPAGGELVSDPVAMKVPALARLAVTTYFKDDTELADFHPEQHGPTSFAVSGNQLAAASFDGKQAVHGLTPLSDDNHIYLLTGVEAMVPAHTRSIIALGDSITDGALSTGPQYPWPAVLATLANAPGNAGAAVGNAGISADELTADQLGSPAAGVAGLKRYYRDVIDRPGVTDVVVLFTANDLNRGPDAAVQTTGATAVDLIAAFRELVDVAHQHGLKIWLGTVTPFAGQNGWYSPRRVATREQLNQWMHTHRADFDGLVDFAEVTKGQYTVLPQAKDQPAAEGMATVCAGDQGLHPNDRGYAAMGTEAYNVLFHRHVTPAQPCH